ncbi:MAG: DNA-binding response regulator [Bacteroidetes bacterium]|nr:MAG: DNA-binding response regulator [Bacteroidota bacterium]
MSSEPLRVLIVDDEPLARQRLEDLLSDRDGVEIIGQVGSGKQAVEAIREERPDLVFLDVQMPEMTGFDVVRAIGPEAMPPTIFVTAYDQYALTAFDVAALDYLVKPFDDDRFEQAFERACELIRMRKVSVMTDKLLSLLQEARGPAVSPRPTTAPRYLERIAVEMRGQVRVVPVERIDFITASGPYAELHVGEETFLIRERMQTLEERLDPDQFFRIHRSAIVQLDRVEALLISGGGDYAVRLKDGRRLRVSRSRKEELEQRLGLDALG